MVADLEHRRPRRVSSASKSPGMSMMSEEITPAAVKLHVVMATPEISPFAKTGGLADVLGSLPQALERLGVKVSLIMPAYRSVLHGAVPLEETGISFTVPVSNRSEEAVILRTTIGKDISVYFIRADKYFDREHLYSTPEGDYLDNAERFVFFGRAILELLKLTPPQLLHCHDWQSALAVAFLKAQPHLYPELSAVKTVFTMHNLGYQGLFWYLEWHLLNLDWSFFTPRHLEFYSKINFLKGGLTFADAITTMSPSYAEEIKTPEQGFGLEGVLQERAADLVGILNGADYSIWNPETDPLIAKTYGLHDLSGKKVCKADLQRNLGLSERADVPVLGMVSRLAAQKGFDLLGQAMDNLLRRDIQFVLLGTGDARYEKYLERVSSQYAGKAAAQIAFSETLAHKIIAGADMLLMPSRYEPSGLTQLYGLKYGTIPIARATGGLKDTVKEFDQKTGRGTGFVFGPYRASALLQAVDRALALFRQQENWATLMKNAMTADFSWEHSAQAYLKLYQKLIGG